MKFKTETNFNLSVEDREKIKRYISEGVHVNSSETNGKFINIIDVIDHCREYTMGVMDLFEKTGEAGFAYAMALQGGKCDKLN